MTCKFIHVNKLTINIYQLSLSQHLLRLPPFLQLPATTRNRLIISKKKRATNIEKRNQKLININGKRGKMLANIGIGRSVSFLLN